jgi:cystathionine beta-lyase/cystathionine gamma-synthase
MTHETLQEANRIEAQIHALTETLDAWTHSSGIASQTIVLNAANEEGRHLFADKTFFPFLQVREIVMQRLIEEITFLESQFEKL